MPVGASRAGGPQQPEPVPEPAGDVGQREDAHPGRGDLQGQRYAVERPADAHHIGQCLLVEDEVGVGPPRPLGEEEDRRCARGLRVVSRPGTGRGLRRRSCSSGRPKGSRLVASTRTRGPEARSWSATSAAAARTCSQLSSSTSSDPSSETVGRPTGSRPGRRPPSRPPPRGARHPAASTSASSHTTSSALLGPGLRRRRHGEARLADAARPGHRHEPALGELLPEHLQLPVAPDQRGSVAGARGGRRSRRGGLARRAGRALAGCGV